MEDPKYTKALYDQLSSKLELGTQADFEKQIGTDEKFRKAIFDQAGSELDLGDYKTYEGYVKKKDSPSDYGLPSKEVFSEMFGNISKVDNSEVSNRPLDEYDPEKFATPDLSLKSPELKGPELETLSGTVAAYVSGERITDREAKQEVEKRIVDIDTRLKELPKAEMQTGDVGIGMDALPKTPEYEEKLKLQDERTKLSESLTTPSRTQFLLGKAYNQSLLGVANKIITGSTVASEDWLKKYDAGTLEDATATALGFMLDMPFFGGMSKVGEVIGKAAAKPIVDRVMAKGVEKLMKAGIEESLAKKLALKAAIKVSQTISGMTSSGVALGSYSAVSDALNQWAVPDANFDDIKWGQSLKAGVKNFALGVGVGGLGLASAAIASKASAIPNAAARIGTKVGVASGGLTAESALFTYGGALLDGKSPNDVTGKEFLETVALLGLLKVSNVAGKIPEAVTKPKETLTNLYRSLQYDPKKPGQGQFEVDIEPWEVDVMGGKDYKSVMDIASKDDKVLADILKSDKVPALLKQKILWGARGVAIEDVNLNADKVVPNEDFVDSFNKEGVLVDKRKYSSKQEAEQASLEMGLQLEDNKMQRRSAEPDVDRVKIISDLQSKGTDVNKLLIAVDKPVKERTPEESKMVGDYYSMIPKEKAKKEGTTEKVSIGERDIVTQSEKNILKIKSESSFNIPILKGKEQVGKATIEDTPDGWRIKWIEADRPDKDTRGAGRDAMILLNKEALKEGKVLVSDIPGKNSSDMQKAWEKLVESGEAVQLPDKTWSFNKPEKPIEPTSVKPKAKTEEPIISEVKQDKPKDVYADETPEETRTRINDKLADLRDEHNTLSNAATKQKERIRQKMNTLAVKIGYSIGMEGKKVTVINDKNNPVRRVATKGEYEKVDDIADAGFKNFVNTMLHSKEYMYGMKVPMGPVGTDAAAADLLSGKANMNSQHLIDGLRDAYNSKHVAWKPDQGPDVPISPKELEAQVNNEKVKSFFDKYGELNETNVEQAAEMGLIDKTEIESLKTDLKNENERRIKESAEWDAEAARIATETGAGEHGSKVDNVSQETGNEEIKPITDEKPINAANPPISKGEENNLSGGTETGKKPVIAEGEAKPIRTKDPVKQKQIEAIDKEYDAKIADAQKELDGMTDKKRNKVIQDAIDEVDRRNTLLGDANAKETDLIKPGDQGFVVSNKPVDEATKKFDERKVELTKQVDALNKERESKIGEVLKQQTLGFEEPAKTEDTGIKFAKRPDGTLKNKSEYTPEEWADYTKSVIDKKGSELPITPIEKVVENTLNNFNDRVKQGESPTELLDKLKANLSIEEAGADWEKGGIGENQIRKQNITDLKEAISRIEAQTKPTANTLNDAVSKYGWSAVKNPEGFWLQNKDGKPIVKVVQKKGVYQFFDMSGKKLMDGRGDIAKASEKLLKDYYYAKEIPIEKEIVETPPVKETPKVEQLSVRDLKEKTVPELDNLITQLESGMKDVLDAGDTKRAEKLNELIGKVIDARNEVKKVEQPTQGIKYKDKTYTDIEQVQDDYVDGKLTLKEQNEVLEKVRQFEDDLHKQATDNSINMDKKMGKSTKESEDEMLKTFGKKKGNDSKVAIRFLPPDPIPLMNTVLYKQLVKVRDAVANRIAGVLQKGMKSQMDLLRWPTKAITNLWGGLGRTQADIHGKGGKPGKLAFTGTVKSFAPLEAKELRGKLLDIVHSDPESLRRVLDALDPDPAFAIEKLNVGDLSVAEKNLYFKVRDWNTWVHETNYANGFLDTETYLKNKDVTGDSKYIARMYDKYEGETLLDPAIQEFINRGNSAITTKMMTDMFKAREETTEWKKEHAIRDPTYLTAKRVMQTIQNVAIKDYMDLVIQEHPDFVLKVKKGEAAPKGYTRLGSSYSWGPFRNKAVINHVVEDFTGFFYANEVANGFYKTFKQVDRWKFNQFYKKLRTVYAPMVQLGNVTGNIFFASVNGINPVSFLGKFPEAISLSKKSPEVYKALLKTGLLGDVAITGEMKPTQEINPLGKPRGILGKIAKPFIWYDKVTTKAYGGADNIAKISAYLVFREQGMSHDTSIRRAYDAFQNYSTVGKTWDFTSKFPLIGPTFAKFQADLQRILVNGITTTPLTLAGTLILIKMAGILSSTLSGETEEERKIRESRKGVAKIPIVKIPLSIKVGKSEVNIARLVSPIYNYNYADAETQLSDVSKYLPLQFTKINKPILGETANVPAFADATWGWIGSVAFDMDYRGISIRNPKANIYHNAPISNEERLLNMATYVARSQVPFFKGAQDLYDGIRGNLDYYGRKRNWRQLIVNNIVKTQEWGSPETKAYAERNIDYLINRFTSLGQRMGDSNSEFLSTLKDAESQGMTKDQMARIYATADKKRTVGLKISTDQMPILMQEIERLTKVYANWNPDDPNFQHLESGKNQIFNVLNDVDLQKKYPTEYSILKKNDLLNKPTIPSYYQGVQLTETERKNYSNVYWSEYIRTLNTMGLTTQEEMDKAKKMITNITESTTHPTPDKTTTLQEMAADAASSARDIANESFRNKK